MVVWIYNQKQTFAWRDKYNITQAENRRIRRAMEKENAKIRGNHRTSYAFNVRRILSSVSIMINGTKKILKQEEEKKNKQRLLDWRNNKESKRKMH